MYMSANQHVFRLAGMTDYTTRAELWEVSRNLGIDVNDAWRYADEALELRKTIAALTEVKPHRARPVTRKCSCCGDETTQKPLSKEEKKRDGVPLDEEFVLCWECMR